MGTRSLKYTYWLEYWTVLRHYGQMNWIKKGLEHNQQLHWIGFIHDELLGNYMDLHKEYTELCGEGYYMNTIQQPILCEELHRDDICRMVFGIDGPGRTNCI